jgi:hypothetical protein
MKGGMPGMPNIPGMGDPSQQGGRKKDKKKGPWGNSYFK